MAALPRTGTTDLHRDLALSSCVACGSVAEITATFLLPAPGGDEDYVRTRCIEGHLVVVPAFALLPDDAAGLG